MEALQRLTRECSTKHILASAVLWCAQDDLTALGFPWADSEWRLLCKRPENPFAWRKKRLDLLKKQWFLLQDDARPHIAAVALTALTEIGGTALKHPPYSPDLAPFDFWAFPTLKRQLRGKRFSSDDEVRNVTASVLKGMLQNNLFRVFETFIKHCKKCIQYEGCYLEKEKNCSACRVIWFWIKKISPETFQSALVYDVARSFAISWWFHDFVLV